MEQTKDVNLFLKYVVPSMASMLIAGSFCIVDTIFIGHGIGETGLAALGISWPIVFFFQAIADMLGSGAAVLISQRRGEGDFSGAQRTFSTLTWLQVVVTAFLMVPFLLFLPEILRFLGTTEILMPYALEYVRPMLWTAGVGVFMFGGVAVMRNDGSPVLAMWVEIVGLLSNIVLDWLFIIYFSWGACGAAWATIASQAFACLIIIYYFHSGRTRLRFTRQCFAPCLRSIVSIVVTGIPIFGNVLAILLMLMLHNYQALRYGGETGLAAYTVISTLEAFGSLLTTGLAAGVQPITAFLHGAGEHVRKQHIGRMACFSSVWLGLAMFLTCCVLRSFIPGMCALDGETADLAVRGALISASAFVFLGIIRVASYYYQSTEQLAKSSLLIYGDGFFALPLCLFTLPLWLSMDGVWAAMPVSRVMLFVLLVGLWYFGGSKRSETLSRENRAGENGADSAMDSATSRREALVGQESCATLERKTEELLPRSGNAELSRKGGAQ